MYLLLNLYLICFAYKAKMLNLFQNCCSNITDSQGWHMRDVRVAVSTHAEGLPRGPLSMS